MFLIRHGCWFSSASSERQTWNSASIDFQLLLTQIFAEWLELPSRAVSFNVTAQFSCFYSKNGATCSFSAAPRLYYTGYTPPIHFSVFSDSHARHLNIQLSEPQLSFFRRIKISSCSWCRTFCNENSQCMFEFAVEIGHFHASLLNVWCVLLTF